MTIDADGSYRLTGNLTVPNANTTAISITSAPVEVTIDLNGFAILGAVRCAAVTGCSPSGSGKGIVRGGALSVARLALLNGSIIGIGSVGVDASTLSLSADRLYAAHNGSQGIVGGPGTEVNDCMAALNGSIGIWLPSSGGVHHSRALANLGVAGIQTDTAVVDGNTVTANQIDGINGGSGSTISHNTILGNAVGIECSGCTVIDNTVSGNSTWGFSLTGTNGYGHNVLTGNGSGGANGVQVTGGGIEIGTNVCGTDATCP